MAAQKSRVRRSIVLATVGVCIWIFVSVALLDIAIERFTNDKDLLVLALWIAGIAIGYVLFLYWLKQSRKRK